MPADAAVAFADTSMEAVCYYAYWASTELAARARHVLQLQRLAVGQGHPATGHAWTCWPAQRGGYVEVDRSSDPGLGCAAQEDRQDGMRNSNCVAIAPTATISNIIGVDASHRALLRQPVGQVQPVGRVHRDQQLPGARPQAAGPVGRRDGDGPQTLRRLAGAASTACRETSSSSTPPPSRSKPQWLVEAAARRQKWIDQAQSLNIYMAGASGKKLDDTYKLAWLRGLKTTYYLRTMSATHAEKSTVTAGAHECRVASGNDGGGAVRMSSAMEAAAAAAQAQMALPATRPPTSSSAV